MLKHEEMIENVHRRIAEYEEAKKMKHSAFKNIFSAIKPNTNNKNSNGSEEGYTEVASGTERIRPTKRMLRAASSFAAVAVLAAGIGATGLLLHRNASQNSGLSDEEGGVTQAAVTTTLNAKVPALFSPFGDFSQIFFLLCSQNNDNEFSSKTYSRIAEYLNTFDWGEGSSIPEDDIPDIDTYEGKYYRINWNRGDIYSEICVMDNGKACFKKEQCKPDGGYSFDYIITESLVYDVDFDTFRKEIEDILSRDVPDKGINLTQRDIMLLSVGEFASAELYSEKDEHSERIVPDSDAAKNSLEKFLRYDFLTTLKRFTKSDPTDDKFVYTVVRYFKTSDTTTRKESFNIFNGGAVYLSINEVLDSGGEIPIYSTKFSIDLEEFETKLNNVLSGKHDDNTETTNEKQDEQPAATEAVTEATNDIEPEQESSENNSSAERSEADIVRAFYASEHNGDYGSFNGSYEAIDENGNFIDYKDKVNFIIHRAEVLPVDRVLGTIADEEDAISKGRELLLNLRGQEYIDDHDKEYIENKDGIKIYRDNPCYIAKYYEDYDIWVFYPTLFSGSSEDGNYHVGTPGSVPYFYIRGCDGKILAAYN